MSCSVFNVEDRDSNTNPNLSTLTALTVESNVILEGLPALEEFCENAKDSVNSIYNLLGDGNSVLDLLSNLAPELEVIPPGNQDFRTSDHDRSTASCSVESEDSPHKCNKNGNGSESPLGTDTCNTISVIGSDYLIATPSTSQSDEKSSHERSESPNFAPPHLQVVSVSEPDENEIDEAFRNVFSGFSRFNEKDVNAQLDSVTLQNCLDWSRKSPLLICNSCLELFQQIPPFQVHIQTCCAPPRVELKQKMDQAAMDQLARSLWKEVFLKELKKQPSSENFMQHEGYLHNELDQLWYACAFDDMLKCRELFIRAAVAIVSRKWVSSAIANDLHRVRKAEQAKSKKRLQSESDGDLQCSFDSKQSLPLQQQSKQGKPDAKKRKIRGRPPKGVQKTTATDLAVRALVSELEESNGRQQRYHCTPETPVSEHGIDVSLTPNLTDTREISMATPVSDSGVDFTPEMDSEIDRFMREGKTSDVDLLAEVANLENLDDKSDGWENANEEGLSENEFVVGKILDRRLLYKIESGIPADEDYEYLVSWEGFGDEENTWEPYEHLKHCDLRLKEFHDRLKNKALKSRRGKRI